MVFFYVFTSQTNETIMYNGNLCQCSWVREINITEFQLNCITIK